MRWVWNGVRWEEVPRLTMMTLTYPGDWRGVCPNPETLKRQFRAFRERWRRKWGAPQAAWSLEFQPRLDRPEAQRLARHWHLYIGLPESAELAQDATDGRAVWDWAREAWWGVVGSRNPAHRYWGVHVRPCFYGRYGEGRENAKRVGDYLWRESGKLAQKETPEGFEGVKWWDFWGLAPVEVEQEVSEGEFIEMRRVLRRKRNEVLGVKVRARATDGKLVPRRRERWIDGLRVTNLADGMAFGESLMRWSKDEARDKETRGELDARIQPTVAGVRWLRHEDRREQPEHRCW
jgi:hypothetical protein